MTTHNGERGEGLGIPMAIIIAGALVAGAIYLGGSNPIGTVATGKTTNQAAVAAAGVVDPVTSKDHIRGNPSAKVVIVEYSDLECPFCKVFHNTLLQLMNSYSNGEVAWVFRHFPIAQLHSKAIKEAEATECAFDQGGNEVFWKFVDKVFATTNANNSLDPAQLPIIAGELGLDVATFNTCLSSGKFTAKIQADVAAAQKSGAQGTPYSVVITKDGKKTPINGAQPFASVKATIDELLK